MKVMLRNILSFLLLSVVFLACEGPVGPPGPSGNDGLDGIDGEEAFTFEFSDVDSHLRIMRHSFLCLTTLPC